MKLRCNYETEKNIAGLWDIVGLMEDVLDINHIAISFSIPWVLCNPP